MPRIDPATHEWLTAGGAAPRVAISPDEAPLVRFFEAVLLRAIEDYYILSSAPRLLPTQQRILREVTDWFDDPRTDPFGFRPICDFLGLQWEAVRERIKARSVVRYRSPVTMARYHAP